MVSNKHAIPGIRIQAKKYNTCFHHAISSQEMNNGEMAPP